MEQWVQDQEYLRYKTEIKPTAARFSFSTAAILDGVNFMSTLEFMNDNGFETVSVRIFELSSLTLTPG